MFNGEILYLLKVNCVTIVVPPKALFIVMTFQILLKLNTFLHDTFQATKHWSIQNPLQRFSKTSLLKLPWQCLHFLQILFAQSLLVLQFQDINIAQIEGFIQIIYHHSVYEPYHLITMSTFAVLYLHFDQSIFTLVNHGTRNEKYLSLIIQNTYITGLWKSCKFAKLKMFLFCV